MPTNRKLFTKLIISVLLSSLFVLLAYAGPAKNSVQSILAQKERPTIEDIRELNWQDLIAEYESVEALAPDENTKSLGKIFDAIIEEIKAEYADYEIYVLARDGELLYDVIATSEPELLKRTHLVSLSRKSTSEASGLTLLKYLNAHDLNFNKLLANKQKALFIDTGYTGTIYRKLLQVLLSQVKEKDPQREAKIAALLNNVEFRLIASEDMSSRHMEKLRKVAGKMSEDELLSYLESMYFPVVLEKGRAKLGLPINSYEAADWVIEKMEHTPKWHGPAKKIMQNGTSVIGTYHNDTIDRSAYLLRQIQFFRHYCGDDCGGLDPASIAQAKASLKADLIVTSKNSKVSEAKIKDGMRISIDGELYQILHKVETGRRGVVYKVKGPNDEYYALKIAKNQNDETLESIRSDVNKAKEYAKLGVPYAAIVVSGQDFVLKNWIEGVRADVWVKSWNESGQNQKDKTLLALRALISKLSQKSAYIGDLNRKNLIWMNDKWVIVDSGDVRYDLGVKGTRARYAENINSRWAKELEVETCKLLLTAK